MGYVVDEETIKGTTKCLWNFACLGDTGFKPCEVCAAAGGEVLFVACPKEDACSYRLPFGNSWICTCPVRKELHVKYGV